MQNCKNLVTFRTRVRNPWMSTFWMGPCKYTQLSVYHKYIHPIAMCQQYPSSPNPNIHPWISPSIGTIHPIQACNIAFGTFPIRRATYHVTTLEKEVPTNPSLSTTTMNILRHIYRHSESKLLSSLSKSLSCLSSGCCSTTRKVATYFWMDSVWIWYASLVTSFPILLGLIHSKSTWAVPMYAQSKCCGAGQLALMRQWLMTSRLLPATFSARTRNS